MKYRNLTIIGSSHVSIESVNLVQKTIEEEKPGIVAVELDRDRLNALFSKKKGSMFIRGVGFKGWLFAVIGAWVEKHIGKMVNLEPGSEMKTAVILANRQHAKIALIDQNITVTLKRFSQSITWRERWNFFIDLVTGMFAPKKELSDIHISEKELSKVPDQKTIKKILSFVKRRYPNFYRVLVTERNEFMAKNLAMLIREFPKEKIVAVVGAGHEDELVHLVKQNLYKESKA